MSLSTKVLKEEIKELFCNLLKVPKDNCRDVEILVDKILMCATMDAVSLMRERNQDKKRGNL
jgi:hypothetical protein